MSGWSTFHGSPPGDSCQFVCSSSSALCPTSIMSQTCSPMSSTTIASSGEDMFQQAASHQPFAGHSGPLVASPQPILLAQGPHVLGHLQMASVLITGSISLPFLWAKFIHELSRWLFCGEGIFHLLKITTKMRISDINLIFNMAV